jgi:hypothetical protein
MPFIVEISAMNNSSQHALTGRFFAGPNGFALRRRSRKLLRCRASWFNHVRRAIRPSRTRLKIVLSLEVVSEVELASFPGLNSLRTFVSAFNSDGKSASRHTFMALFYQPISVLARHTFCVSAISTRCGYERPSGQDRASFSDTPPICRAPPSD